MKKRISNKDGKFSDHEITEFTPDSRDTALHFTLLPAPGNIITRHIPFNNFKSHYRITGYEKEPNNDIHPIPLKKTKIDQTCT